MKIYQYKHFKKWADVEGINQAILIKAVEEIEQGLFDANLGAGVYKKRLPRKGHGKSSGYRTLIAFKAFDKAFFILGFSKNERENINMREKKALKRIAKNYLSLSNEKLVELIAKKELFEVSL